ncbi:small polypeptide DEVIL 17 [Lathyrus oleraceus]|uniref:small polypeptide DEVIL 17 n=1 Tax=Pisum sativum TaxID=3888 RepID=UPI0021CE7627|nr:small polypeptide DEVIL 17 [Pisum sativum]
MGQCASSRRKIHRKEFSDGGGSVDSQRHGCFAMVKEQKSRFYIVRRCIMMLICWHKYDHEY